MKCLASQSKSEGIRIRQQAVKAATRFMYVATASVLTDKYGFGKRKIQQVMKSIGERADSINKGYISLDELEEILSREYDIVLSD